MHLEDYLTFDLEKIRLTLYDYLVTWCGSSYLLKQALEILSGYMLSLSKYCRGMIISPVYQGKEAHADQRIY